MSAGQGGARLAHMANEIARAFASQPRAEAAVAEHLKLFWNSVMLRDLIGALDKGEAVVDPVVAAALRSLTSQPKVPPP